MNSDEEDSSGSDIDDALRGDLEALERACRLAGGNTSNLQLLPAGDATIRNDSDNDDDEDDIQFVRNIQKRFEMLNEIEEPLTLKPICSIPTIGSEDSDDDFETLRAIQRRFAAYDDDPVEESVEKAVFNSEQVGVTNIASEKETSNNFFVESSNALGGFPNCVDKSSSSTQSPEARNEIVTGSWPSEFLDWHKSGADNATVGPIKGSGFPNSAQAFVDAIKKNRSCQQLIRRKLMHIEARVEEIKMLKDRIKILKDFQVSCKVRTGRALSQKRDARVQLISAMRPRTRSKINDQKSSTMHNGPTENSQVANYREALKRFPVFITREKWSDPEKESLAKGVRQQLQEMLLQRSLDLVSCADGSLDESANLDSIVASIRDLDITPENMRAFLPMVNWDHLASMYVSSRSGAECQARWLNYEDPLINNNSWSTAEDKNLLRVVQQKGLSNWIDIAVSLGTDRTPFQCLARYQRSLNASIIKREWTKEEDNQLRAAVEAFGEGNWQVVASSMEGRTGTQCSNRWMKTLHPARQKVGQWTSEEDKRLKVAVMLFGPKTWKKVAEFIPGRTHVQCRERWVNSLDPSLNLNKWTEEEDLRLKEAIREHGYCWSKVAACVHARTDNQCWRRWKVLCPHEVPLLQAARSLQRAALISNFVDRESERSSLGPGDFAPATKMPCISQLEIVPSPGNHMRRLRWKGESGVAERLSGDQCIEEVLRLTNGNEVENATCNKRWKGPSGRTPHTVNSAVTSNEKMLDVSGGCNLGAERDRLHERGTASRRMPRLKSTCSRSDAASKKRRKLPPRSGGGPETENSLSSLSDPSLPLITNGGGNRNNKNANCHETAENRECFSPFGDPGALMTTTGNDANAVARNDEAAIQLPNGFGKPLEALDVSLSNPVDKNARSEIARKKRREVLHSKKKGKHDAHSKSPSPKLSTLDAEIEELCGDETGRVKKHDSTICARSEHVHLASGIELMLGKVNDKPSEERSSSCSSPVRFSASGILENGNSKALESKKLRRSQARDFLNKMLEEEKEANVASCLHQPGEVRKSLSSSVEAVKIPLTNYHGSSEWLESQPITQGECDKRRLQGCSNGDFRLSNLCTEEIGDDLMLGVLFQKLKRRNVHLSKEAP